jgi:RimJ/RimL family protein N-acetyltransferase
MARLIRHDLSETDVRPGSTLRPITRFELERDGDVVAGVTFGRAEVFERQPWEYTLARWSFPAGDAAAGAEVLSAGADPALRGAPLYLPLNGSVHDDVDDRCAIARESGFELAVERHCLVWTDSGQPLTVAHDLRFRTVAEIGRARLAEVMAGAAATTLDRNDRLSLTRQDPRDWADRFIRQDVQPADEKSWLLAESPEGEPVGVTGISAAGDSAILCYLCVVPGYRGRGLGEQLVYAGYRAARRRGLATVSAYVDAVNRPMAAALERAGAQAEERRRRLFVRS